MNFRTNDIHWALSNQTKNITEGGRLKRVIGYDCSRRVGCVYSHECRMRMTYCKSIGVYVPVAQSNRACAF